MHQLLSFLPQTTALYTLKIIRILGNSIRVSESVTIVNLFRVSEEEFRDLGNPKVDDIVSDKNLAPETDYPFPRRLKV